MVHDNGFRRCLIHLGRSMMALTLSQHVKDAQGGKFPLDYVGPSELHLSSLSKLFGLLLSTLFSSLMPCRGGTFAFTVARPVSIYLSASDCHPWARQMRPRGCLVSSCFCVPGRPKTLERYTAELLSEASNSALTKCPHVAFDRACNFTSQACVGAYSPKSVVIILPTTPCSSPRHMMREERCTWSSRGG